jgi:hypothetical protein
MKLKNGSKFSIRSPTIRYILSAPVLTAQIKQVSEKKQYQARYENCSLQYFADGVRGSFPELRHVFAFSMSFLACVIIAS